MGAAQQPGAHNVTRHAGVVSFFTFLSRIAGLLRESIFSHLFGATHATDAFLMAFTIPNTFRMLVAEGTLTVAFLPVLNDVRAKEGDGAARRLMGEAMAVFPSLSAVLCAAGIVFAEPLVLLFAGGFADTPGKLDFTVHLTRWMFPYLALISFVALAMGGLNAYRNFASSSASPLLFNLTHIVIMVAAAKTMDEPMLGLSIGVLIGGLVQVGTQLVSLRRAGLAARPRFALSAPIRRILSLMTPALAGLAVYQLNILVLRYFSSHLGEAAPTYLYLADRFLQLPLGVFGIAIATASLPALSEAHVRGATHELIKTFTASLRLTNFISIPASLGLLVLALPICAVFYQHGKFDHAMARETAAALAVFSLGLVPISGIRLAGQVFFAVEDTRTPVLCSAVGLACNIACAPLLAQRLGFVGLAASVSLAAWVQLIVQLVFLRLRLGPLGLRGVMLAGARDLLCAGSMAALVDVSTRSTQWSAGFSLVAAAHLGGSVALGSLVYGMLSYALRAPEARSVARALRRRLAA